MKSNRKRIYLLLISVILLFLGLSIYLVYFQVFEAEAMARHSANRRNWVDETTIQRGSILSRGDTVIAHSIEEGGSFRRIYDGGAVFAPITGYNSLVYGKTGLERAYNTELLNLTGDSLLGKLATALTEEGVGNDVKTTIDYSMQERAYAALEGYYGSMVVMDAKTGEVHAMVSKPSFNPQSINDDWLSINEREDGTLLNRATQGMYTPGSIMKMLSAVSILESGLDDSYEDTGSEVIDGFEVVNVDGNAYGSIDLEEALIYSSNTYFAHYAEAIGAESFKEVAERFGFNKPIDFDLPTVASKVSYEPGMEDSELAASSFGQGETLVTPLQMAMLSSAIANDGIMMKPMLVKEVISSKGVSVEENRPSSLSQVMDASDANALKKMLESTVSGNGYASIDGYEWGGKTGTAEVEGLSPNAWFVGFFEDEEKTYSIALVLEEGGSGSVNAAPRARDFVLWMLNR